MTQKKDGKRFVIYLAGPITGCNDAQKTVWRMRVRNQWESEFDFIDPTEQLVSPEEISKEAIYEVIKRDEEAIKSADALLANMWKESIGTATGMVIARKEGKPVVAIDQNHLGSRVLAYYADAVCETEQQARKELRSLLKQQNRVCWVIKKNQQPREEFHREKLAESVRKACQAAGKDDVIAPAKIIPLALEKINEGQRVGEGEITTSSIKNAVWESLAELESDPLRGDTFAGVRRAWELYDAERKGGLTDLFVRKPADSKVHKRPLKVLVHCTSSHTSIWGVHVRSIQDVPKSARPFFNEICRIEGIREVRLTEMSEGPDLGRCLAELIASKNPATIEGKCYDRGKKGNMQAFQVLVLDEDSTESIRETLLKHLRSCGMLRLKDVDSTGEL